ncbi:HEAT repeat domain-containing protein [Candidatus Electronema sp. PJ]|uniref:HEAT repeat domain-containing protein n=1 Tax=Candidatus Electronema sp. PJ TaxID=3401572 RepID=UPI003AA823CB
MKKRLSYLPLTAVLLLSTAVPAWSAARKAPVQSSSLSVQVENGLLTLQARNTPLRDLLQQIASQVGVEIVVYGTVEQPVSGDFNRVFIEDVLRRITQDLNSVFLYKPQVVGQTSPPLMEKVFLYTNEVPNAKGTIQTIVFRPGAKLASPAPPKHGAQSAPVPDPEETQAEGGEDSDELSLESITEMANDEDSSVREEAVALLGDLEDGSGINQIAKLLHNDDEESVRRLAAEVLGNLSDQQAVQALGKALSDRSAEVRTTVVEALGQIASEEAVVFLKKATKDRNEEVRQAASEAIEMAMENAGTEE